MFEDFSTTRYFEEITGTNAIATIREHKSENTIVNANEEKSCPIIPIFCWNIINGRKIQTVVKVDAVIEPAISSAPKTAATSGFASLSR